MSFRSCFQQHVVDARLCPILRVPRNPDFLRNLVGGREADPVDVLRQHVGIAPHLFDCLLAVGLEDAHRPARADAVAMEEQHDFPYLLCFLPCVCDPLPALGADAVHGLEFGGSVLDHYENLGSEAPDQLLRQNRPDALHQSAAQIPLDPLGRSGRYGLHGEGFKLQPVLPVSDPDSRRAQPFPCGHRGKRPDDRRFFPVPLCFYAKHTEAALVVMEGDPLDDAGDFFGSGPALWDCGIHRGFIFAWVVSLGWLIRSLISSVWLPWVESWSVWRNISRNRNPRGQMSKQNSQILIGQHY